MEAMNLLIDGRLVPGDLTMPVLKVINMAR
jgi:hypothetical protein